MFGTAKVFVAAVAFVAPVAVGVAYTGADSIGGDDSSPGQSEDQFILSTDEDGTYSIDRWQTADLVTIVITGPDGNVVQPEDLPANVAGAVADYSSPDWMPADRNLWSAESDGTPCYNAEELADPLTDKDGTTGAITSSSEGLAVLESYPDGTVDAAFFADPDAYSEEELEAHRDSGAGYLDLEGAQPLNACGG